MPHETNLFTEETGYEFTKYGNLTTQRNLCDRMGAICVGIVQEGENSWSLRENVQLLSFESIAEIFPSIKQLIISKPSTYLKVMTCSCVAVENFNLKEDRMIIYFNFIAMFCNSWLLPIYWLLYLADTVKHDNYNRSNIPSLS